MSRVDGFLMGGEIERDGQFARDLGGRDGWREEAGGFNWVVLRFSSA